MKWFQENKNKGKSLRGVYIDESFKKIKLLYITSAGNPKSGNKEY